MRTALLTLTLISCVQDVDIGLNDGGTNDDTGNNAGMDTGMTPVDTGVGVDTGTGGDGGLGCSGDAIPCIACGMPYPPRCVNNEWVCDPITCTPCNVDSECVANSYCNNNFALESGMCEDCPPPPPIPCPESFRQHQYGNGCGYFTCDQPELDWLEIDPSTITFFSLPIGSIRYAVS
jgi:hypothetical protein